jgi:hypothetical protein
VSTPRSNEELFQGLVFSLAAGAMQHLGKTMNPLTNKIEKNLEAAQATIDMLDMLEAKTRGNLSDKEAQLLKHVLGDLKLNFVETMNEKPAEPAKEDASPAPAPEA